MNKFKHVLPLFFLIGIFINCSDNEIIDIEKYEQNQEISFYTLRNKMMTRYANDNESTYQVYAFIDGADNWYFNTIVTPTSSTETGATDSPAATYYWPGTTKVSFYSYAPSEISSETGITNVTATAPSTITIDYSIPSSADIDFTIATPVEQSGPSSSDTNSSVSFTFSHMLAKISITLSLSDALKTDGYSLVDSYTTNLIVPYNNGTIDAGTDSPTWKLGDVKSTTYTSANDYIVIPQTYSATDSCALQIQDVEIKRGDAKFFAGSLKSIK